MQLEYVFHLKIFLYVVVVHPLIQVPNMLVGAPIGVDITLVCNVEASPKAINYWQRENGKLSFYSYTFEKKNKYFVEVVAVAFSAHRILTFSTVKADLEFSQFILFIKFP